MDINCKEQVTRLISYLCEFLYNTDYCQKLKSKTKRHYYGNIKRFLQLYFRRKKQILVPQLNLAIGSIGNRLNKECLTEKFDDKERTKENKLTLADVDKFFKSDHVKLLEATMDKILTSKTISREDKKNEV